MNNKLSRHLFKVFNIKKLKPLNKHLIVVKICLSRPTGAANASETKGNSRPHPPPGAVVAVPRPACMHACMHACMPDSPVLICWIWLAAGPSSSQVICVSWLTCTCRPGKHKASNRMTASGGQGRQQQKGRWAVAARRGQGKQRDSLKRVGQAAAGWQVGSSSQAGTRQTATWRPRWGGAGRSR